MRKLDLKKPPMGWNSFDCFGSTINEEYFYSNLDTFIERLKPAGYEYVVIDIAWYSIPKHPIFNDKGLVIRQKNKAYDFAIDEWGRYLPSPMFFPNGFEPIIKRVHDAGLKFGLHLMRGVPVKAVEEKMPILGADGITADMIINTDPDDRCPWNKMNIGIDMTKKGAQEYYDSVMQQMADWGVDLVKYDDIEASAGEMTAVYNAIEKATGEIVISLSLGSYDYLKGQIPLKVYTGSNFMRISHDIWDQRKDLEDIFEAWAQRSVQEPERPEYFFFDLDMIPFGRLKKTDPPEQFADADSIPSGSTVERDCRLNKAQMRTFITQRAMAASPLFMGGYLPETDEYSFSLITNKEMIKCNQNAVTGHPVRRNGQFHIFRTPMKGMGQEKGWVGIFNRSEEEAKGVFNAAALGLNRKNPAYKLYDVWNEKEITLDENGKLDVTLEADDVMFLSYEIVK